MPKRKAPSGKRGTEVALEGPSLDKTGVFSRADLGLATPNDGGTDEIGEVDSLAGPYRVPRAVRLEREGAEPLFFPIHPDRTYVFGRAPESSFVFPSDAVSRLHAQLRFSGGGCSATSTAGTAPFCW